MNEGPSIFMEYITDIGLDAGSSEFNLSMAVVNLVIAAVATFATIMTAGMAGVIAVGIFGTLSAIGISVNSLIQGVDWSAQVKRDATEQLTADRNNWVYNGVIPTARDRQHGTHWLKTHQNSGAQAGAFRFDPSGGNL